MNGYIAFYNGRRAEIYTDTLHQAKEEAIRRLKVPKSKQRLLAVELAETNVQLDANGNPTHGTQHIIKPDF